MTAPNDGDTRDLTAPHNGGARDHGAAHGSKAYDLGAPVRGSEMLSTQKTSYDHDSEEFEEI